jgi:hypothetical protein
MAVDIDYCDAEAQADPRYQYAEATFNPAPGTWAPDCGHPACVADDDVCVTYGPGAGHEWDCPVATCRLDTASAACGFAPGHDGDHSWALPPTPEARLVPYEAPRIEAILIQVVPEDDDTPRVGQPAEAP